MPGFNVEQARNSGYSDDEIISHLLQSRKFNVDEALKSGYSKTDIINHLAGVPSSAPSAPPQPPEKLPEQPWYQAPADFLRGVGSVPLSLISTVAKALPSSIPQAPTGKFLPPAQQNLEANRQYMIGLGTPPQTPAGTAGAITGMATPVAAGLALAPVPTISALATGTLSTPIVKKGAELLGAQPEQSEAIGSLGGMMFGGLAGYNAPNPAWGSIKPTAIRGFRNYLTKDVPVADAFLKNVMRTTEKSFSDVREALPDALGLIKLRAQSQGKSPQSVDELIPIVDDTMTLVRDQINTMLARAQAQGKFVSKKAILDEVRSAYKGVSPEREPEFIAGLNEELNRIASQPDMLDPISLESRLQRINARMSEFHSQSASGQAATVKQNAEKAVLQKEAAAIRKHLYELADPENFGKTFSDLQSMYGAVREIADGLSSRRAFMEEPLPIKGEGIARTIKAGIGLMRRRAIGTPGDWLEMSANDWVKAMFPRIKPGNLPLVEEFTPTAPTGRDSISIQRFGKPYKALTWAQQEELNLGQAAQTFPAIETQSAGQQSAIEAASIRQFGKPWKNLSGQEKSQLIASFESGSGEIGDLSGIAGRLAGKKTWNQLEAAMPQSQGLGIGPLEVPQVTAPIQQISMRQFGKPWEALDYNQKTQIMQQFTQSQGVVPSAQYPQAAPQPTVRISGPYPRITRPQFPTGTLRPK